MSRRETALAVGLVAVTLSSCGAPTADTPGGEAPPAARKAAAPDRAARLVGAWVATDGTDVGLTFGADGVFQARTQGTTFLNPGRYRFADPHTVEITGENYVLRSNLRPDPVPMSFTVDFEDDDRTLKLGPTESRPFQMEFSIAGNRRIHVFPPQNGPVRYKRAGGP